jgi:hypothetical protein
MKTKIFILFLIMSLTVSAEERFIYFDDQNIFYYKKNLDSDSQNNNYLHRLNNASQLISSKFDILYYSKKEKKIDDVISVAKNNQLNLDRNGQYFLNNSSSFFYQKRNLFFHKEDKIIHKFELPFISLKNKTNIFNQKKDIKKRNIFSKITNYFDSSFLVYSEYNDQTNKVKIKNINVRFDNFDKNVLLIDSNQNIKEIFIKFESEAHKHIAYFNKKFFHDNDLQYFSATEKITEVKHMDILRDLKKASWKDFYITEIQFVFTKNNEKNMQLNSINFYEMSEKNVVNFKYLERKNNLDFLLNINDYAKLKLEVRNLQSLNLSSDSDLKILFKGNVNTPIEGKFLNYNLSKLQKKILEDDKFIYAEIFNINTRSKIYFVIFSLFPFLFLSCLIIFLRSRTSINKKLYSLSKKLMIFFTFLFLILILISIYLPKFNQFDSYIYFILIFMFISYLITKKFNQDYPGL